MAERGLQMAIDAERLGAATDDGAPVFVPAGTEVDGEFYCASCGYGVAVRRALPSCPMCGGGSWEPPSSSPFLGR